MAAFGQPVTTPYGVRSQPERTQGEPYKAPAPPVRPMCMGPCLPPLPVTSTASPGYSTVQRTDPKTGQLGLPTPNGGMTMDANTANPLNKAYAPPPPAQSTFTGVDGKPATSLGSMFAGRDALITRLQQQQSVYAGSNGKDLGRPTYAMPNGFGQSQTHGESDISSTGAPVSTKAAPTTNTPSPTQPAHDRGFRIEHLGIGDGQFSALPANYNESIPAKNAAEEKRYASEVQAWNAGTNGVNLNKSRAPKPVPPKVLQPVYPQARAQMPTTGQAQSGPPPASEYRQDGRPDREPTPPAPITRATADADWAKSQERRAEQQRYNEQPEEIKQQKWNEEVQNARDQMARGGDYMPDMSKMPGSSFNMGPAQTQEEAEKFYNDQEQKRYDQVVEVRKLWGGPPPAPPQLIPPRETGTPPNAAFLNRPQTPAASPTPLRTLTQDDRYNPNIALFDANQATSENAKKLGANFTPFRYDPSWSVPTASEAPNSQRNPTNEQRYNLPRRGVNPNIAIFEANQAGDKRAARGGPPAQPYHYDQSWPEPVGVQPANSTGNRTNAPVYKFRTYN